MKVILTSQKLKIPEGVTVEADRRVVTVSGPRGKLRKNFRHQQIDVSVSFWTYPIAEATLLIIFLWSNIDLFSMSFVHLLFGISLINKFSFHCYRSWRRANRPQMVKLKLRNGSVPASRSPVFAQSALTFATCALESPKYATRYYCYIYLWWSFMLYCTRPSNMYFFFVEKHRHPRFEKKILSSAR